MLLSSVLRPPSSIIRCLLIVAVAILSGLLAAQTPQEVQKVAEQAIRRLDLQTVLPTGPEQPRFTNKLPIWRWGQDGTWTSDDVAPGDIQARTPAAVLGAADELAAAGRFVEAMHVLLLQGLAEIRQRLDEQFADSLTSREILRSTRLSEAGRTSLRDIIHRVELTYFGQRPATLPDYVACRTSFNALAQALRGIPAA